MGLSKIFRLLEPAVRHYLRGSRRQHGHGYGRRHSSSSGHRRGYHGYGYGHGRRYSSSGGRRSWS